MRIAENQEVILGPPGTGKTTEILNRIEKDLTKMQPEQIALVSFTRKAVQEAVERVCTRFKLSRNRFGNFQTVHAMCYRLLACNKSDLMSKNDFMELGEIFGYELTASINMEDGALILPDREKGSKILFLDNLARTMRRPLRDVWKEANADISWAEVERFATGYATFKKQNNKMDFTDLLEKYIAEGKPVEDVRHCYIDEAQDLSRIQWEVLQRAFCNAEKVVVAGDDDQSIFKWSGADLQTFLKLEGTPCVLGHSYRLPKAVHGKAAAIIKRVKQRFDKEFTPTEKEGTIKYVSEFDHVKINPEVKTLVLVRNVYLLNKVYDVLKTRGMNFTGRNGFHSINEEHVRAILAWEALRKGDAIKLEDAQAIYEQLRVGEVLSRGGKAELTKLKHQEELFSWETLRDHYGLLSMPIWHKALLGIPVDKREYYISMLRRKQRLTAIANIHVNTIHGVKGGEADHVVIISDMSRKTYEEMQRDPCSEHRVAYVAVTRTKQDLTIVLPQSSYSYSY